MTSQPPYWLMLTKRRWPFWRQFPQESYLFSLENVLSCFCEKKGEQQQEKERELPLTTRVRSKKKRTER